MNEKAYQEEIKKQNAQIHALRKALERLQVLIEAAHNKAARAQDMTRQLNERLHRVEGTLRRK